MESIEDKSHLAIVEEILYDGAPLTNEQHLEIIAKELDGDTRLGALQTTMDYARRNIDDLDTSYNARLQVSEKALSGIKETYSNTSYDSPLRRERQDSNRDRVEMALETVSDILLAGQPDATAATMSQAFAQAQTLQCNYISTDFFEQKYFHGTQDTIPSKIRETYADMFSKIGKSHLLKDRGNELGLPNRVHNLMLAFITYAETQEDPSAIVGMPLYRAYIGQVGHCVDRNQQLRCADKAMDHLNTHNDDVFEVCIDLISDRWGNRPLSTPKLLDRTLEAVRASSHEEKAVSTVVKSRFGFKREVIEKTPSDFEVRRKRLNDWVTKNLPAILEDAPGFVKQVTELYPEDAQEGQPAQAELWQAYGQRVAAIGFTNGHYSRKKIKELPSSLKSFSAIAPAEATESTREAIRERLAASTAAS